MLMDYLHTYPDAIIHYYASNMILQVNTDAAYLVLPKTRQATGVFYLSNNPPLEDTPIPNGAIDLLCKTIPNVVSTAAEVKTGGTYMNRRHTAPIRETLQEMGHPQLPTRITGDNSTTKGLLTRDMQQKLSKTFDMRYFWMRDRIKLNQ